jgi:hypothetical protein
MSFVCATLLYFHLKRENARRDAAFGPPPKPLKLGETHSAETLKRLGLEGKSEADIIELGDYAVSNPFSSTRIPLTLGAES